jgi:hypothetical protein
MQAWTIDRRARSMAFGVEQERFLLRGGGAASDVQAIALLDRVVALIREGHAPGLSGGTRIEEAWAVDCRFGAIKLSFEGYPHQVEAALPPVEGLDELIALHEAVWGLIGAVAGEMGLELGRGAYFRAPGDVRLSSLTPAAKRLRFVRFEDAARRDGLFSSRTYLASVCSTQVHLDVGPQEAFELLPALYSYMYVVPALFSVSRSLWDPDLVHNVRMLVLRDSYPPDYPLALFPLEIPTSPEHHQRLILACDGGRDYSLVAPRAFGTLEFRAADAQTDPERLAELCAFYLLLVRAAAAGVLPVREEAAALYWRTCQSGAPDPELLLADLIAMGAVAFELPDPVREAFSRLLKRAHRVAASRLQDAGREARLDSPSPGLEEWVRSTHNDGEATA